MSYNKFDCSSRDQYGSFKILLNRNIYFDNDTLVGHLQCNLKAPLHSQVIIVRLRCVLRRVTGSSSYTNTTLYRANRILTTNCSLNPSGDREDLDCEEPYKLDFSFPVDNGYPNTFECEMNNQRTHVEVEWYVAAMCRTVADEHILLAKTRFTKSSIYVPQIELQPKVCLGKAFLVDRIFQKHCGRVYAYASLDKNVYTLGESIMVAVSLVNESRHVKIKSISAKVKQIFRMSFISDPIYSKSEPLAEINQWVDSGDFIHNEKGFVLELQPKVICNCHKARMFGNGDVLAACAGIVHLTRRPGSADRGSLAVSSFCQSLEQDFEQEISYMVIVKVAVTGGMDIRLRIPFYMTNPTNIADSVIQAHLISAIPIMDPPPCYESIRSLSTDLSLHVRGSLVLTQEANSDNTCNRKYSFLPFKSNKSPSKLKYVRNDDNVSDQIENNNAIEV